ncbi:MAG: GIY-YIG nuclease family protein [Symploca sp. SIO2G7]|nr:GIY-YIG nuclease family protein [Symploca sp. SIO2G7]
MSLSENSIDPQVLRIKDIPQNREGWVYLIHAVGTNRYKIGRSVNPVARYETLKKQSPYPLQILGSFWTVDVITDEARLHQHWEKSRVYGEWFENPGGAKYFTLVCSNDNPTFISFTKWHLFIASQLFLSGNIGCTKSVDIIIASLMILYDCAQSRKDLVIIDTLVYSNIVSYYNELPEQCRTDEFLKGFIDGFLKGAYLREVSHA